MDPGDAETKGQQRIPGKGEVVNTGVLFDDAKVSALARASEDSFNTLLGQLLED